MSAIKSHAAVAQAVTDAISSSLSALDPDVAVIKDTQTTVSGNSHAHQAIDQLKTFNTTLVQAIGQAGNHIQTIATEFAAMDQQIAKQMVP